jgi:NAD(P) transhydrogenase subunit beta
MGGTDIVLIAYLVASVLFVYGIKYMGRVRSARQGNFISGVGMLIAIGFALYSAREYISPAGWAWIGGGALLGTLVGAISAYRVPMTSMPEMVALFNGAGGAASFLVALSALFGWSGFESSPDVRLTSSVFAPDLLPLIHVDPETSHVTLRPAAEAALKGDAAKVRHIVTVAEGQLGAIPALAFVLTLLIGGITLSGSIVAYLKLSERIKGTAVVFGGQHALNFTLLAVAAGLCIFGAFFARGTAQIEAVSVALTALALVLGVLLVIPIGGADMPVVISLLNSYSGMAAAMTGFVLNNSCLCVAGALVGASGIILTAIMCKAMNRSLISVLAGGFGATTSGGGGNNEYGTVKSIGPEEFAMMLDGVSSVVIVPGYGLAVAQAQHLTRELGEVLEKKGATVRYAIHPVAGRMPGHMNVLLAEANVPYEQLVEMDQINADFKTTDMVIVLGANDVVNPAALDEPQNPLYGMPILMIHEARNVIVVKRSLSPGYAGVKNKLFELPNCQLMFFDAKKALQETLNELKAAA